MNLQDTLFSIEKFLGLELDSLAPYAAQDNIGGYHPDESQRKWPPGAIWDVEGRILYALICALEPRIIVEIGSGGGCSTNHMAAALYDRRIAGGITTIDRGNTPRIEPVIAHLVEVLPGDGVAYLESLPDNFVDFILEDGEHSAAQCHAVAELAKRKLVPGGVLLAHDAAHFIVGNDVIEGYNRAGIDYRVYLTEPSDCGWLVWKKPKAEMAFGDLLKEPSNISFGEGEPVLQADGDEPEDEPPPPPKPKRTRKKAAK